MFCLVNENMCIVDVVIRIVFAIYIVKAFGIYTCFAHA